MCGVPFRAALARRVYLSGLWRGEGLVAEDQSLHLRVRRLQSADLGDRGHDHPCQQAGADRLVLGGVLDGDALQRDLGAATAEPARSRLVPHCLDVVRQAASRHGQPRARAVSGLVEADETIIPFRTKDDPVVLPAGRSGVGKILVAGAVEIDGGRPRRARLKVIAGFGKPELHSFVLGAVAPQSRLVTDDWSSYRDLPEVRHNAITLGPMAAHVALPWIHRLFSNLKRWGLGVYHGLRKTNLQHDLDEFVFRFNRRRTRHAAFDTLLGIGARTAPAPYRVLIRKAA
jgi:hypothetical protein